MKHPLISIIIPVYNVEKYLRQCLDSLLVQTYKNIEIICFNDASTDNSLEILNEYSNLDYRIKVINSTVNVKQGGGRNRGIKASSGEFICFVDSDDWVAPQFIEKLYVAISANQADIATADYYEFYEDGRLKEISHLGKNISDNSIEIKRKILLNGCRLVTSIFKRNLFFDNNLFFPERLIYEDNAVGPALFLSANNIVKIDDNLYYYRQNQTSTTKQKNNYKFFDRLETSVMALNNIKSLPNYNKLSNLNQEIDWLFIRLYLLYSVYGAIGRFNKIPIKYIIPIFNNIYTFVPNWKTNKYYKEEPFTKQVLLYCLESNPKFMCKILNIIKLVLRK